jgi:nifR3 family TIM-barrel protein
MLQDIPKLIKMTEEIVRITNLPVTVKTRLGWDDKSKFVVSTAEKLQDVGVEAISIHGRTRQQLYKGDADWTLIGEVKNNPRMHIPIFGNGDIDTPEKALDYRNRYGVDGIMIGRAAIGYPWIFNEIKYFLETGKTLAPPTVLQRIEVCKTHFEKSVQWKGERPGIFEMRRHYAPYFKGLDNFKPFRTQLVMSESVEEILEILVQIENHYQLEPEAV